MHLPEKDTSIPLTSSFERHMDDNWYGHELNFIMFTFLFLLKLPAKLHTELPGGHFSLHWKGYFYHI